MNLQLREITRADLPAINRWRADREVVAGLGTAFRHICPEVDEKWFDAYLAARASTVRLAICADGHNDPVGVVYLLDIDRVHRSAEFAIQIGEAAARGRGYGEWATRAALAHAFRDLNLNRIWLTVLASNRPAMQLYQKIGFVEEGRWRQAIYKDDGYIDLVQMAILRDEYFAGVRSA